MEDKILHFAVMTYIYPIIFIIVNMDYTKSFKIAFLIGFLKEMIDLMSYGLFSMGDLIADTLGIFVAMGLVKIVTELIDLIFEKRDNV